MKEQQVQGRKADGFDDCCGDEKLVEQKQKKEI
jgi:hypothetical protein